MFLTHITAEDDRWDTLAWRYYRDIRQITLLIDTNPHAPISETLPAGLTLLIPLIAAANSPDLEALPAWKR